MLALLGLKLDFLPLTLTGAGAVVVVAVALVRENLSLGRMLRETLQVVARRARLRYAPSLRAHAGEAK